MGSAIIEVFLLFVSILVWSIIVYYVDPNRNDDETSRLIGSVIGLGIAITAIVLSSRIVIKLYPLLN